MASRGVRSTLEPLALTLLRIATGVIMATHGWQKFQDVPAWINTLQGMGVPAPQFSAYLSIAGELGGGLGLILGLLTPIAAFGVFCTMAVAVFKVHFKNGLLASANGFEYPMTLMLIGLYFIMRGAGPISLDALFCRKKHEG